MTLWRYCTRPTVAKVTRIDITTISSTSVKPRCPRRLPVTVFRPVESGPVERRVHVEHVLAAPPRRVRIVLIGAKTPIHALRHGIDGDAAQKFQLPSRGVVVGRDAFHERFEVGRVPFA